MRDPLQRLYKTKLVLLATTFTVVGLALIALDRWSAGRSGWQWIGRSPVLDIGSALFTTGLVAVVFTYFDGQDSEQRANERLKRVLREEAPAIRDAVIEGFAFKGEDLARVATPELLDDLVTNSLALRLGDEEFARDIYTDVRDQAIRATERWRDARISIRLSRDSRTAKGRAALYVATVSWEYSVIPTTQTRRFTCVGDRGEYRDLADDPTTSVWFVNPAYGIDPSEADAFELVQFAVDGAEKRIQRSGRSNGQTYSVNVGKQVIADGELVTIGYTYRTVVPADGHLLHLDLEQPTKGVRIDLDYTDVDLRRVTTLDFIAGSERSRLSKSVPDVPGRTAGVGFDGWIFPRSGVVFVWGS